MLSGMSQRSLQGFTRNVIRNSPGIFQRKRIPPGISPGILQGFLRDFSRIPPEFLQGFLQGLLQEFPREPLEISPRFFFLQEFLRDSNRNSFGTPSGILLGFFQGFLWDSSEIPLGILPRFPRDSSRGSSGIPQELL